VVIGGAYDGDAFYNCLFENPNENNHNWIVLKLEGDNANKAAVGARVVVTAMENGIERKIHRTVTTGASFGANSLILEIGLGKAATISGVTVQWPCLECPDDTYTGLEINKAYTLREGKAKAKEITYTKVAFATGNDSHHGHH
jgi:hypothetical protein